ncbi:MAG: tyrosine--tRNA ligase [Chloroflexi bacterium]|nr:tyrosine--tRNA ligase [Chloroflexota bacterium]MYK61702.1 tyrosine--tRNA ligase [Chloroflexota bacterium]
MSQQFTNIVDDLQWRGALSDATPGAEDLLINDKITCYNGFDPTSDTLHIGNLLPLMCLSRLQRYGHTPIAILGGGTGMIGDPSGRTDERTLLSIEDIDANGEKIRVQLEQFLDFDAKSNPAQLINNADWLRSINYLDFLRDIGKSFTVNTMIRRDSVRTRMEREGEGISYTEFSYALLQAYDFLMLYEREGCNFQSGGTDQWGNILDGVDLIRRKHGPDKNGLPRAHGIVFPLITDSKGDKLGKSIGGAPALDSNKFSPYRLYQFFFNTDDADVIRYIKLFTWLEPEEVGTLEEAVRENPDRREAQQTLAEQITQIVHGQSGLEQARRVTRAFFRGEFDTLSASELDDLFEGSASIQVEKCDIDNRALSFEELAVATSLAQSFGDARRTVQQGGMYLNSGRVDDPAREITPEDLLHGNLIILRRGRREHRLVRVL